MDGTVVLRRWTRDDLPAMAGLINDRVAREGEGEYVTDASIAEQYDHFRNCDPVTDIVVAVDRAGIVVGYARVFWHDVDRVGNDQLGHRDYYLAFEASPDVAGLDGAMFDWGIDRGSAIAAAHDHPDRRLNAWATLGTERAARIESRGFKPFAWSAVMVRDHLDDLPVAPLPAGLELRPVEPAHWRRIWEADIEAFRDHRFFIEQTETDWERFIDEAKQGTALWQVAWDGDDVVGQVRTRSSEEEIARLGRRRAWTEDISTRREWRGRGVASALITSSLGQLATLGYTEAALGVDLDNPTGALGVYERLGYEVVLRGADYHRAL